MLTSKERCNIITYLSQVNHPSIWGEAIRHFNYAASGKTDEQVEQLVLDLQSQIDDNPTAMKEILGHAFHYIDNLWRKEDLNINNQVKQLIKKAVTRYPMREQQANALGINVRTLQIKLQEYKF